ncbi:MAG: DUF2325 domain-containing protein, partial [Candidatus Desulforudis sp.]|nr:DUF2325 domain-containing protein [Bacillota bacterium]MBV1768884.1 DUF2325 domain-containing protein [Desulforudis sp.]
MSILIIGGDRLGNILENLRRMGFKDIQHVSGRKKGHLELKVTSKVDVVLILTDFVNHELAKKIKGAYKNGSCQTIFARRAWCHIKGEMDRALCNGCCEGSCPR